MKNLLSKSLSLLMVFLLSSVCLFANEVKLSKRATYVGEVVNKLPHGAGELTYLVNKKNSSYFSQFGGGEWIRNDKALTIKGIFEMKEKQKGVIKGATITWLDWTIQAKNVSFIINKKNISFLFSENISMSVNLTDGEKKYYYLSESTPYLAGNYIIQFVDNDLELGLICYHDKNIYQDSYHPNVKLMWFYANKSSSNIKVSGEMGDIKEYCSELKSFLSNKWVEPQTTSLHISRDCKFSKNSFDLYDSDPSITSKQFFNPSYILSNEQDTLHYSNGLICHRNGDYEYMYYTFPNGDFIELSWDKYGKAIYREHFRLTLNNGIIIENDPWDNQNDWIPYYHITYPNGDKYDGELENDENSPLSIEAIFRKSYAKFNFDMVPKLGNGTYTMANGTVKNLLHGQTEEEARLEEEAAQKVAQEYHNNLVRKYGQKFAQAILKQEVIIGMTKEMLYEMDYKWERTYKSQGEYATYEKYKGARKGELEEYQVAAFLFGNTSDISTAQALYEYEKSLYIYVELRNNKVVEVEQR